MPMLFWIRGHSLAMRGSMPLCFKTFDVATPALRTQLKPHGGCTTALAVLVPLDDIYESVVFGQA